MEQELPRENQWHPNRNYLQLNYGILIDSCFPGGNVANANIIAPSPLTIEVEGNTDVSLDTGSKYWLYFRIRGFRKDRPLKMILKNANHLRKYSGQSRYKPYMMVKQEQESWQAIPAPIDITISQNGQLQGTFTFQSDRYKLVRSNRSTNELYLQKEEKTLLTTTGKEEKEKGDCYFAIYQPYNCDDLQNFIERITNKRQHREHHKPLAYIHDETVVYSYERRKVHLVTITSANNIESFSEKEPLIHDEIFPNAKDRPHKLKNNPVVFITARVHPSETYSSFFIEGFIDFLLSDCKASLLLRELFIFQIIPMLNPDGVEHGNFRFDHEMRNLNRYYGQSSIQKTPSIRAAELLLEYFKNRNNEQCEFTQFYEQTYSRLFMYIDVHGHSSAMPSFIYGNHSEKMEFVIQNKMFCKLIESNFLPGGFSKFESEFSKKNMTAQQKYDQFSKMGSGRVFAGKTDVPELSLFHSYTLEVLPYWQEVMKKKNEKAEKCSTADYSRLLGKETLVSLLDLLDLNPESKFNELQLQKMRKFITKQCYNQQARKAFLFRRAQSSGERSSYSQISKIRQGATDFNVTTFYNQYINRWFNNQILLKHLSEKTHLMKQHKFNRFYQRISKITQIPNIENLDSSPPKDLKIKNTDSLRKSKQKMRIYQSAGKKEEDQSSRVIRSSKCFISREDKRALTQQDRLGLGVAGRQKEKIKVEGKISKQTLELRQQFYDFALKLKTIDKEPGLRFPKRQYAAKRDASKKDIIQSPQKYEKQLVNKIQIENHKTGNALFQIKVKEIKPKPKSNVRIHTQGSAYDPISSTVQAVDVNSTNIKNCSSQVGTFILSNKLPSKEPQPFKNAYHKPSFIQEFIIRIREEREIAPNSNPKFVSRDELRQRPMKYKPTIRDQIQEQDKNLLPVLRRNKIFTIASEPCQRETNDWKQYETILHNKKRVTTIEAEGQHLQQLVSKTKKILGGKKEEAYYQQNIIKKSEDFTENIFS